MKYPIQTPRLLADFNGVFGKILCLSHSDSCKDEAGKNVFLAPGMVVTAFDMDADETGKRDDIFATGIVAHSPDWLQCKGSRWILEIDENGIRNESDLGKDAK